MTNHWIDLRNADVFMVCGSNPAENHPVSWNWVEQAREEHGAKVIVVDPRFTRTASKADAFSFIRPGTDIVFYGALVNYAIQNNLINWEYVQNYTNAPILVNPDFKGPGELDGLFSGYDADKRKYDTKTWSYQAGPDGSPLRVDLIPIAPNADFPNRGTPSGPKDSNGNFVPNEWELIKAGKFSEMQPSVYAKLAEHYSRYTYEGDDSMVAKVCGMDPAKFKEIADIYVGITHQRDKSGNLMYAMGMTQFTIGTEKIRAFALLQLLMGNTGMPGGGINALRGESNVQGSTDFALLSHIIPAYLGMPNNGDVDYQAYLDRITPKAGYWVNSPKFMASLLTAWWGEYANKDLAKAFELFPKVIKGKNYTHIALFEDMYAGIIKGMVSWGQNPPVGGPNCNLECAALDKLNWLVAVDIWDTEMMNFWQRPGAKPEDIQTEVWALPAASSVEKGGSVMTSGRLAQYRWKAVEPPGDARTDAFMAHKIIKAVKELYKSEGGPGADVLTNLFWEYDEVEHGEPNMDQVLFEIHGFTWPSGTFSWDEAFKSPVLNFTKLAADGTTVCGNWLYSGEWASDDDVKGAAKILGISDVPEKIPRDNQATEWNGIPFDKAKWHFVKTQLYWWDESGSTLYYPNATTGKVGTYDYATGAYGEVSEAPSSAQKINVGTYPVWGWAWPVNRRIIYNRCSMDYSGKPFAPQKALFLFDESGQNLVMKNDVNDFYAINKKGSLAADSGAGPYIMNREVGAQVGRIFSNSLVEGPFPEHYEPREGPVKNALSGTQWNPAAVLDWPSALEEPDKYGFAETGDTRYPYVATTYRVTEHWQAGQMTRNNTWLGEAMPEQFVELSVELADELGIKKGDLVEVESVRGKMQGVAVVTTRLKPLQISDNGSKKTVHVVGMTWHFGFIGFVPGGPERNGISDRSYAANQVTGHVGDANTTIPEYKAFLVNLRKVN
ncbi:MAG: molybdopterin-dependent oxidoreductase [Actinobacteria bacterium]|nr:molybdopterin-dependent oxidoreductase [Actinomycetota bacterium]